MGLEATTRKRWAQLRPNIFHMTEGRPPPPNPVDHTGHSVVLVDFNTFLHPMFNKTNRVARSEIAEAFMSHILSLLDHYCKKTQSEGLRCLVLVIDHAESKDDGWLGDAAAPDSVRVPHPQKIRTIVNAKEYSEETLMVKGDRLQLEAQRKQALEEKEEAGAVPNLALGSGTDQNKAEKTYRYRYEDDGDGVQEDKAALCPSLIECRKNEEEPQYHWGKLMEERSIRDTVWQDVLMLIAMYNETTHGAWCKNLKAPVYVRHGPRDVMLLNPSVVNPRGSRRRIRPIPVPDQPPGVAWLRRDLKQYGWFAEADKEVQRLAHEYACTYPEDLIVVHSIDTDFLLYLAVAMQNPFALGKTQKDGFKGRVVMANHLAMRKFAHAWWCDISELLRLVHVTLKWSLFEFTVLTVLGGTDFFCGRITHQQRLWHQEDPKNNTLARNCLPQFWSPGKSDQFNHYQQNRGKPVYEGFSKRVKYAPVDSDEVRNGPALARVENIVYRAISLDLKRLKFNHVHYENILNNVQYILSSESMKRKSRALHQVAHETISFVGVETYVV